MADSLIERQLRSATREGRALVRTLRATNTGRGQGVTSGRGGQPSTRELSDQIGRQLDRDLRSGGRGRG